MCHLVPEMEVNVIEASQHTWVIFFVFVGGGAIAFNSLHLPSYSVPFHFAKEGIGGKKRGKRIRVRGMAFKNWAQQIRWVPSYRIQGQGKGVSHPKAIPQEYDLPPEHGDSLGIHKTPHPCRLCILHTSKENNNFPCKSSLGFQLVTRFLVIKLRGPGSYVKILLLSWGPSKI